MRFIGLREIGERSRAERRVSWYRCNRNKDGPMHKRQCSTGPDVTRRVPIHTLTRAWNSKRATGASSSGHRAPYMENIFNDQAINPETKQRSAEGLWQAESGLLKSTSECQNEYNMHSTRSMHCHAIRPAQKCEAFSVSAYIWTLFYNGIPFYRAVMRDRFRGRSESSFTLADQSSTHSQLWAGDQAFLFAGPGRGRAGPSSLSALGRSVSGSGLSLSLL